MEIYQLKTFVVVARCGSITRAAQQLHLSQPAVSAHIKTLEDTSGLTLFERTVKGMRLTGDGAQLLEKAEATLTAHRELLAEAGRIKGRLSGHLRLAAGANSSSEEVGRLLLALSNRCPEVSVTLQQADSCAVVEGLHGGRFDAGFFNGVGALDERLEALEVARFGLAIAAPKGMFGVGGPVNWQALADLPWVCSAPQTCCGRAVERLFQQEGFRPQRVIHVDRESVTRTLVGAGVGVGLLHSYTAQQALACGEVDILGEVQGSVPVLIAWLRARRQDPLIDAVARAVGAC